MDARRYTAELRAIADFLVNTDDLNIADISRQKTLMGLGCNMLQSDAILKWWNCLSLKCRAIGKDDEILEPLLQIMIKYYLPVKKE